MCLLECDRWGPARWLAVLTALPLTWLVTASGAAAEPPRVDFVRKDDRVVVQIAAKPVAAYIFRDKKTPRPYFAHVRNRQGVQVTRNHPPQKGDAQDHATYHPGIFMAFGDLSGSDNWRLKATVVHERFLQPPRGGDGKGGFVARHRYLANDRRTPICQEVFRCRIHVVPQGWLLEWSSDFSSEQGDFYFGDQEEMGLGVRVATPLAVRQGGRILDSEGRVNGKQVWGKAGPWVDYGGTIDGIPAGLTVFAHPQNFRPSWRHARDYGFVAMNPFGVRAFTRGKPSKIVVPRGKHLRLRYGVLVRGSVDAPRDLKAAYAQYVQRAGSRER